jgi:non-ribosomal peptide synthase protein (TIGR01720 family)
VLRYLSRNSPGGKPLHDTAQMSFNYLGQFDQTLDSSSSFRFVSDVQTGNEVHPAEHRAHLIDVVAYVRNARLTTTFGYSRHCYRPETMIRLAEGYRAVLTALIDHCVSPEAGTRTASDFPLANLTDESLDSVLAEVGLLDGTGNRERI